MKCRIKQKFSISGKNFEIGSEDEFTDEQINRLPEYIEPIKEIKTEEKNINFPPEDKMVKVADVNITKKRGRKNK